MDRPGWIYEEKVDGWRIVAYKDGARIRLVSRRGVDHMQRFHDVAVAVAGLKPQTLVLDGEVAVFDQPSARASTGCVSYPMNWPRHPC